jgi:CRP-like cAMP-binding protein
MNILAPSLTASSRSTIRLFGRYDSIVLEPDILWRIERGVVRTMTWNEKGKLIILGYWGTGDVVGQPLSRVVPYQIECLTSVETSRLTKDLWHQAINAMLLHTQQTEELLTIVRQDCVAQRLWNLLLLLSQKFGRETDSGRLIDLVLTHQDLAETINATRVTVTRALQQFESEGILLRHRRRLILLLC